MTLLLLLLIMVIIVCVRVTCATWLSSNGGDSSHTAMLRTSLPLA